MCGDSITRSQQLLWEDLLVLDQLHELPSLAHLWVYWTWFLSAEDLRCCDLLHSCAWSDARAIVHAGTLQPA